MLGFCSGPFRAAPTPNAALFAATLTAWGLYSNQKTPIVLAGLVALGYLTTRVRKPSAAMMVVAVLGMPVVLAVAAIAFSNFRGGAGFDLADRPAT